MNKTIGSRIYKDLAPYYYLYVDNVLDIACQDLKWLEERLENYRRVGRVARIEDKSGKVLSEAQLLYKGSSNS